VKIAILVPYYHKDILPDEEVSLYHLRHYLSSYSCITAQPMSLQGTLPGCEAITFEDKYFTGTDTYSRLLLSSFFYERFLSYDYILIHQLDCVVFSGELDRWCQMGYDYIGAPLFEKKSRLPRLSRAGNGGLSLRRVKAFLDVLNSPGIPGWHAMLTENFPDLNHLSIPARWLKIMRIMRDARRGVKWYSREYGLNEDLFWSDRARLFDPGFRIAPLDVALRFAFESHPRLCFENNGRKLPFGAHAWAKWDRAFWEPFLLS
jgi:hypothetical protein